MPKLKLGPGTAALPLATSLAVAWMLLHLWRARADFIGYSGVDWKCTLLGPPVLLASATCICYLPRIGYAAAAAGSFLPLPWFFRTESRTFGNSWIAMNASFGASETQTRYFQFRIVSVALLTMTLVWACTRLLPERWRAGNRSLNRLTWPAMAASSALVIGWFAWSVLPYRQPLIVDGMAPEISILHVEKDRSTFHETRISVYRDSRYFVFRNDRRLFRYSFAETVTSGVLKEQLRSMVVRVKSLPELQRTSVNPPRALRVGYGEGWYVSMGTNPVTVPIATFTTENGTQPSAELVAFFRDVEASARTLQETPYVVRDVCLGFCFDPKAGLGYRAANERCSETPGHTERCY